VLDRAAGTLQPCTEDLCPLAVASNRTKQLVNAAPLYTVYRSKYFLAPAASTDAQAGIVAYYRFLSLQFNSYSIPLLAALGLRPAYSEGSNSSQTSTGVSLKPLLQAGYNAFDTLAFLPAFTSAIMHPNQLQDVALPGAAYARCALHTAR
jgi:hypothetical protein